MTDEARARLETMVRHLNGLKSPENRSPPPRPGEFFGTRQSGDLGFHIANPLRDSRTPRIARREAFTLAAGSGDDAHECTLLVVSSLVLVKEQRFGMVDLLTDIWRHCRPLPFQCL